MTAALPARSASSAEPHSLKHKKIFAPHALHPGFFRFFQIDVALVPFFKLS